MSVEEKVFWFNRKFNGLPQETDRLNSLIEIKTAVNACEGNVLKIVARSVSLENIFDCLNTSENEELEAVTSILSNLLSNVDCSSLLDSHSVLLERALNHPSPIVKRTLIECVSTNLDDQAIQLLATSKASVFIKIVSCIDLEDLSIAQASVLFLKKLGAIPTGLQLLYSTTVLNVIKNIITNDVSKFRVYEVIMDVSIKSDFALQLSHNSGILPQLINELQSDDCLIQLNVLELLTILVETEHGWNYLNEQGIIGSLCQRIININNDPMPVLILPGLINFLGNLIKLKPFYITREYPNVLKTLFESLDNVDESLLPVLISTVGYIGSTNEGKLLLNLHQEQIKQFLIKLSSLLQVQNDNRIIVLNSIANLFNVQEDNEEKKNLHTICEKWFKYLGQDVISILMKILKLPFIEQRLGVYNLLLTICKHPWGLTELVQYPGFIEYLLDRSTEHDKNCKNYKYDVVKTIIDHENISNILGTNSYIKLKEFVRDGPFYVETQPEMAFEGAT